MMLYITYRTVYKKQDTMLSTEDSNELRNIFIELFLKVAAKNLSRDIIYTDLLNVTLNQALGTMLSRLILKISVKYA